MKCSPVVYVLLAISAIAATLFAQGTLQLHVSTFMTPQEMNETGIANQSPAQRAAFERWLTKTTQTIFRAASATGTQYSGGSGHWVDEVSDSGAIVVLEDDSVWIIESSDRVDTGLWLATTDITVSKDRGASGNYTYILTNTEDHEKAHAKYAGKTD